VAIHAAPKQPGAGDGPAADTVVSPMIISMPDALSPTSSTERIKEVKLTTKRLEKAVSLGISDFVLQVGNKKF
jgi:hypothetical protein